MTFGDSRSKIWCLTNVIGDILPTKLKYVWLCSEGSLDKSVGEFGLEENFKAESKYGLHSCTDLPDLITNSSWEKNIKHE